MPEKTIQFILTRIFEVSFEGGALWLVWLFWQVRPKTSLSIWQNCCPQYCSSVSCWQLLCTLNKCAVAWVGSVQQECRWSIWHMKFLKFQTKFLLNEKHNHVQSCTSPDQSTCKENFTEFLSLSRFCLVTQWALCCMTRIKKLWGRPSFPNK